MARIGEHRTGRRFTRRPVFLAALGLLAGLGAASALAATKVLSRHPAAVASRPLSISIEPASRSIVAGGSARYSLRVARNRPRRVGLSGRTDLHVTGSGLPSGARVFFGPQRGLARRHPAERTVLTVTTAADTPARTYLLAIHAQRPHRGGDVAVRLVVTAPDSPATTPEITSPALPPAAPDAFRIAGSLVEALHPGSGESLDLELTNLEDKDLLITSLGVALGAVAVPSSNPSHPCAAGNFSVEQFSGAAGFTLPAASSVSLSELGFAPSQWPRVSMLNLPVNQDGCKLASLSLSYSGSATEVTP